MGRSGGGGGRSSGGGHSHSGGSHGSSHSHSSSHSSGGGRSYHSSSSYSSHSSHSYGGSYHQPYYHSYGYDRGYGYRRRSSGGLLSQIIGWIIVIIVVGIIASFVLRGNGGTGGNIQSSTIVRERVDTKNAYINDCIEDEIGWIKNKNKLSANLKYFYEKTGCQPYIILRAYDSSMSSSSDREQWSQEYYDTHFADNQNVVLYTYFCDKNDEGNGDDTLFVGTESGIVMDSEAMEIFWNYLDYDWDAWDSNDNDGMFNDVFHKTADRIMKVTTTKNDVKKTAIIFLIVLAAGGTLIVVVSKKFKRDKEKAQETIDILNAPIDKHNPLDDLADKYNNH